MADEKSTTANSMRAAFPGIATVVDEFRAAFWREAGGRFTGPDGGVLRWGQISEDKNDSG